MDNLDELQNNLKYKFNNIDLLKNALSHTSYAHEHFRNAKSNERLEFLGDTILNLAISDFIYNHKPEISEGNMSKIRATVICEDALYEAALKLNYNKFIMLGVGEERLGGRNKASILADAFEAVIAAIYLDSDFYTAKEFVLRNLEGVTEKAIGNLGEKDHKTKLQEILQSESSEKISYEIVDEKGPDHNKQYVAVVKLGKKILGQGKGTSKKEAEQNAANVALKVTGDKTTSKI